MPKPDKPNAVVDLYDGQVTVKYYDPKHVYMVKINTKDQKVKVDGRVIQFAPDRKDFTKVKSVTQVTKGIFDKPMLTNWQIGITLQEYIDNIDEGLSSSIAEKNARAKRFKVMQEAGIIGTALHAWQHDWLKNPKTSLPAHKVVRSLALELKEFIEKNKIKIVHAELIVYNPFYDVAGTLDLIFEMVIKKMKKLGILDTKTASGLYPEYFMQIAYYRETFKLMTKTYPEIAGLLHIPKDGSDHHFETEKITHEEDLLAFESALYLDRWRPNKEPEFSF